MKASCFSHKNTKTQNIFVSTYADYQFILTNEVLLTKVLLIRRLAEKDLNGLEFRKKYSASLLTNVDQVYPSELKLLPFTRLGSSFHSE